MPIISQDAPLAGLRTELATKAPLTQTQGAIAYANAITLDIAALNGTAQTITLSGPLTLAATGLAAGRSVLLRVINDGAERNLSFPSDWAFVGAKPTVIAAGFVGRLRLDFWGDSQLDCVADWRSGAIGVDSGALDFSALTALPSNRRSAVTTAANAAATTLGVSAQSIIDALAVGRGFCSMLPSDGCLLASSGGAPTTQGDPVGAVQSWAGVELATQSNTSLQPVSAVDGLFTDGSKNLLLGNLSNWAQGEAFSVTALATDVPDFSQSGYWTIGTSVSDHVPLRENGEIFTGFGSDARFAVGAGFSVSPFSKKIVANFQQTGTRLILNVGSTTVLDTLATVAFNASSRLLTSASTTFRGTWYGLALNSALYTAAQRSAVREFCRNYYGVTF